MEPMQELKEVRAGGVRNLEEAEEFEMQRRKRAAESVPSSKGAMDRSQRYTARTGTDDSSVMSQVHYQTPPPPLLGLGVPSILQSSKEIPVSPIGPLSANSLWAHPDPCIHGWPVISNSAISL